MDIPKSHHTASSRKKHLIRSRWSYLMEQAQQWLSEGGHGSPLLVALVLVALTMVAVHHGGGNATRRAIARLTGGGVEGGATTSFGGSISSASIADPDAESVLLPESMSRADLDTTISQHHPLNRLQCGGSWPEAYAKLHRDIMSGVEDQRFAIFRCDFGSGSPGRVQFPGEAVWTYGRVILQESEFEVGTQFL